MTHEHCTGVAVTIFRTLLPPVIYIALPVAGALALGEVGFAIGGSLTVLGVVAVAKYKRENQE